MREGGDDTAEQGFDIGEVGSIGADVASIVDAISAHSEAYKTRICLFWTKSRDYDAEIGGIGAFGEGRDWDKHNCFCASGQLGARAATEASNFVGAQQGPPILPAKEACQRAYICCICLNPCI